MSFKFGMYKYALFHRASDGELPIQRKYADRSVLAQSWQKCARAYPDRHVILFSRLSEKEQQWFITEEDSLLEKKKKRDPDCPDRILEKIASAVDATIERDMESVTVSIVFATGQKVTARNNTLLLQNMLMTLATLLRLGVQP